LGRGMKAKMEKDNRRRKEFAAAEPDRLFLKALKRDQRLPVGFRQYLHKFHKLPEFGSRTRIKNRCIISGRGRAVYTEFGLCRIKFRDLALMGKLPGVRLSSW